MTIKSTTKSPYGAALVVLLVIWSLWYMDLSSVRGAIQRHNSETGRTGQSTAIGFGDASEAKSSPVDGSVQPVLSTTAAAKIERPLILYAYSETTSARTNLEFFIRHGLHAAADFIFILNGATDATTLIPLADNIRYVQRANDCYDLGAFAEVLTHDDLYKNYKKFIMLNASIRGPFLPYWAESCWSDMYLKKVTDKVKLVGMTGNCWPVFHVQSMIWATDIVGLEVLLNPTKEQISAAEKYRPKSTEKRQFDADPNSSSRLAPGINHCFHTWSNAVNAEIDASQLVKAAGYGVDVMMSAYHKNEHYEDECDSSANGDVLWEGKYEGTNVHPFETIFLKSNRDIDPVGMAKLTEWTDGRAYSSYNFCKA
ncbi:hypothetical protein BP5796_08459 [Coleophoma crateriformis]|uniref:Uncharacterized protein n=1 Tax=Coleophoma crateriformis TaxID=565419 RepID=A0A3D8R7N5_9HELO|nr:hypothetical protein BP5796_08459 [Coleophoma crateriformis]